MPAVRRDLKEARTAKRYAEEHISMHIRQSIGARRPIQAGQQTATQNFCNALKQGRTAANGDLKKMRKSGCSIDSLTKQVVAKFNRYNCDQNNRCGMDGGPSGGKSDPVDEIIYPTANVGDAKCGWGVANPVAFPQAPSAKKCGWGVADPVACPPGQ